jgi:hypothetical protein
MTLQQILNLTTAGGAIVAVALVGAAWARARSEFRSAPSAASMPRLPARRRGIGGDSSPVLMDDVGLRIIEPRGPAASADSPANSGLPANSGSPANSDLGIDHASAGDTVELTHEAAPEAAPAEEPAAELATGLAAEPSAPSRSILLTDHVTAGAIWTSGDSWLTSTTAVGSGVLAAIGLGVGGSDAGWLLAIYALSAALAPLIYGCLSPGSGAAVTGSVRGFLLAALATMFGGVGMVATILGLAINSINGLAADVILGVACVLLIAAMSSYAFRTIVGVLLTQTTTPAGDSVRPAGHGIATPSLLVGSQGRRSATL